MPNLILRGAVMALLAMRLQVGAAHEVEVAWDKVQRQLQKNAGVVAHRIAVRFEVPDDTGRRVGRYQTRIGRWTARGHPVRELVKDSDSTKAYELATLDLSLAERIANRPDQLFQSPESITVFAEGVYAVRTKFIDGSRPVTARIWIDSDTGALQKIEGTMEKVGLPEVASANFSLRYVSDADGRSLPESLSLSYTLSLFFHSGEFSFIEKFSDWRLVDVAKVMPGAEQR